MSEKGHAKYGLRARGVRNSVDYGRDGSGKVRSGGAPVGQNAAPAGQNAVLVGQMQPLWARMRALWVMMPLLSLTPRTTRAQPAHTAKLWAPSEAWPS